MSTMLLKRGEKESIKDAHITALASVCRDAKITCYVRQDDGKLKVHTSRQVAICCYRSNSNIGGSSCANLHFVAVALSLFCLAIAGFARDAIDNGQLQVKPYKHNRFQTGTYRMGKAELFGYIGELKDSKHITGIVLRDGDRASVEQKHIIASYRESTELNAFIELDDKLQALVDPTPAPAAPVAPAVPAQPSQPPAAQRPSN